MSSFHFVLLKTFMYRGNLLKDFMSSLQAVLVMLMVGTLISSISVLSVGTSSTYLINTEKKYISAELNEKCPRTVLDSGNLLSPYQ